jgi:hypothetical protein
MLKCISIYSDNNNYYYDKIVNNYNSNNNISVEPCLLHGAAKR